MKWSEGEHNRANFCQKNKNCIDPPPPPSGSAEEKIAVQLAVEVRGGCFHTFCD
jgi:hypothetical protein